MDQSLLISAVQPDRRCHVMGFILHGPEPVYQCSAARQTMSCYGCLYYMDQSLLISAVLPDIRTMLSTFALLLISCPTPGLSSHDFVSGPL